MRKVLRDNALTIALLLLFSASFAGQLIAGHRVHAAEAREHGDAALGLAQYATSGHFVESVFENWESEFLQMGLFVILTKWLKQKGSSESKKFDGSDDVDEDPGLRRDDPEAPWPVKRGGVVLFVYEHSLSVTLMLLFLASMALHAVGGARHHQTTVFAYVATSQFWFESFQNWQSEFLSVLALVILSIFLRERGSPQSKPVAAPHVETGD